MLLFARRSEFVPRPEWTKADAEALRAFLTTGTGQRLQATMISEIGAANERAAMKAAAFECGWACGYRALYAWFEALSAKPAAADESGRNESEDPFGEDGRLDHLNP